MKRRTFVRGTAAAAVASLRGHAMAQTTRARILRFVPQANLTVLDPIFTSTSVTRSHGYLIYDTLFASPPTIVSTRRWQRAFHPRRMGGPT